MSSSHNIGGRSALEIQIRLLSNGCRNALTEGDVRKLAALDNVSPDAVEAAAGDAGVSIMPVRMPVKPAFLENFTPADQAALCEEIEGLFNLFRAFRNGEAAEQLMSLHGPALIKMAGMLSEDKGNTPKDCDILRRALAILRKHNADAASSTLFDYHLALCRARAFGLPDLFIPEGRPDISRAHYDSYVRELQHHGMDATAAEWCAYHECCEVRNAPYPRPERFADPDMVPCPYCHGGVGLQARNCVHCGTLLWVQCPECGRRADITQDKICACGFPLRDMPRALEHIDQAKEAVRKGEWSAAELSTRMALLYWPRNQQALSLYALLEEHRREVREKTFLLIKQTLTLPGKVQARLVDSGARISWSPAMFSGKPLTSSSVLAVDGTCVPFSYKLIRKEGGVPASVQDGVLLSSSPGCGYDDTFVEPVVQYGYRVFTFIADRCLSEEDSGCLFRILPQPEIGGMSVNASSVSFKWKSIPEATGYRLSVRTVAGREVAARDLPASAATWTETGLEQGENYVFSFSALFEAPGQGKTVAGDPVCFTAIPTDAIEGFGVDKWQVKREGGGVQVSWHADVEGVVRWYLTMQPLGAAGSMFSPNACNHGPDAMFTDVDYGQRLAKKRVEFSGTCYVTPVVEKGGAQLIGEYRQVCCPPPAEKLVVSRHSAGGLSIVWEWPESCKEALVILSDSRAAETPDTTGTQRLVVHKDTYDINRALILPYTNLKGCYVSVFCCMDSDGTKVYSAPATACLESQADKVRISYFLDSKLVSYISRAREWKMVIQSSGSDIPAMVLYAKNNGIIPSQTGDGDFVLEVPKLQKKLHEVAIPAVFAKTGKSFRFFLKDPLQSSRYIISFSHKLTIT